VQEVSPDELASVPRAPLQPLKEEFANEEFEFALSLSFTNLSPANMVGSAVVACFPGSRLGGRAPYLK
jgi:hypothetical protein